VGLPELSTSGLLSLAHLNKEPSKLYIGRLLPTKTKTTSKNSWWLVI